ncbi:hypothetical protein C8A03DRAFT_42174 [Achaetomium macrosporum]|uniref:Uncharacterized protein n=1 Tax=Achaetomium macrosporum TaxID=79813 RepID=A0AAN7H8Q8_9PEZI|nr:hypothetical protein C8A03DRAFT_42174 [Achaetomium macrosporum]
MCLLNGERLDNSTTLDINSNMIAVAGLTTSQLLETLMFREFRAPEEDSRSLTFNKGCRWAGVAAQGQLWELGPVVDTAIFRKRLPWIQEPYGRLTMEERRCPLQVILYLKKLKDEDSSTLAEELDHYLTDDDANAVKEFSSFKDLYLHKMAKLRLGCIWDPTEEYPYRTVFV